MRIVLTGGGSGGHFYPLIAVAEALEDISKERRLIEPELYYFGPEPFDRVALAEHDITHKSIGSGRIRYYRSVLNFFGLFKTLLGVFKAIAEVFKIYPDAVFSTGGFAAYPTLVAARVLRIPVIIYDADAAPGRVSLWSSKFALWIAVAHPDAASKFPEKVRHLIARVGHPIRKEIESPAREGGHEFLKLEDAVPTIFATGGSQGAVTINNTIIDALPALVDKYNIVHQTGTANLDETARVARLVLDKNPHVNRYRPFGLLNTLALRMTAGISSLIIARAGSGTIFEIASWGIPSILVPIPQDVSHDQTENAFSYARAGACVVIEQQNLTPHLLLAEIERIINNRELRDKMSSSARNFARPNSAGKIARIIIETAIEHEPA
ncbi:MAG TPA: UDP-N-acetylglucosamine--N-acetylmuramyl-(pentapeptide) pyrophosphoryl-undecaprenol N-acetylglucosamine transferase [Candidatus Paceibacterota bacterium]|nr:UDP-N-acetylglucosamine--N-acetylmuramyl-(pentapeptide) pyrophosphoryl-undecaprenol N-acetylglucosamine transferase [Candidatus Paceibacterota bacterium]